MKFEQTIKQLLEDFNILPTSSTPPNTKDIGTTRGNTQSEFYNPLSSVTLKLPNKKELNKAKKRKQLKLKLQKEEETQ